MKPTNETIQAFQHLHINHFAAFNLLEVIQQPGLLPDTDVTQALEQKLQEQFDHLAVIQSALGIDSVFPDMTQDQIDTLAMDCMKELELEDAA